MKKFKKWLSANSEIAKQKKVAIILARKNSQRLRNKHLILIKNKPLIQYTFDYAKKSKCLDDILCSTDCPQIARLAELSGIQVVKRPPSLARNQSPIIEAIEHALFCYAEQKRFFPGVAVILYGNVPYRSISLEKGLEFFYRTKADAVFTAKAVSKYHPDWMFRKTKNNQMIFDRDSTSYRCQDLLPYYCSTDSFIIAKPERLLKRPPRHHLYSDFGDRIFFIEEDQNIPLLDIDTINDLNLYRFFSSGKFSESKVKYWSAKG